MQPPRFCLGITPRDDESLPGILLRLAARLRMPSVDWIAARGGLRQPGSSVTSHDLGRLAAWMDLGVEVLEAAAYRPAQRFGHNRFLGGVVHRELLDLSRRRACPMCLAAWPYHRAAWDFALLTACPDHGTRLLDRCCRCRRKFDWRHPDVVRCRCGADLRSMTTARASAIESSVGARMLALLRGQPVPWLPSSLTPCDGSDLVRLAMCLGMWLTGWTKQRRVESLVAAGPERTAQVMIAGVDALADWPLSVHGFLERQKDGADRREGRFGAKKTIGAFYDWLTMLEDGAVRRALVEAVRDFVADDDVLARRMHRSRVLASGRPARGAVSLTEAAAMLGTSEPRVKRMVSTGMLPEPASAGRGVPMVFERAAVERVAKTIARLIDLSEAARMLAVPEARARRLAECGILRPVHRAGAEGWGQWAFDRADVETLLSALEGHVRPPPRSSVVVGWEHAVHALGMRGLDIEVLVRWVREGRLSVAAVDRKAVGLRRLRFERDALLEACRDVGGSSPISLAEAARRLGLKRQVAAHLIAAGLLEKGREGVSAAALASFAAEYVTGARLSYERRTSPRSLAGRLAASGVLPVVGPAVDGSRQNVYRRRDVDRMAG